MHCGCTAALQGGHATLTEDALKDKEKAVTGEGVSVSGRLASRNVASRRAIEPVSAREAVDVSVDMGGGSGSGGEPSLGSSGTELTVCADAFCPGSRGTCAQHTGVCSTPTGAVGVQEEAAPPPLKR